MEELIDTGEEFIAFENLCSNLHEVNFPLTLKLFDNIDALGNLWDVEVKRWKSLRKLVDNGK